MEQTVNTNKRFRESGVELFKIIAILLICISHAVQTAGNYIPYSTPSLDPQMLFLNLFRYFGMIGNTIFVVCSAYYLFDSEKSRWDKAFNLLLDSMFISIACLIGMLIGGYQIGAKEIVKNIFPDIWSKVWFVPFYVLLYVAHPFLNAGLQKMNRKTYLSLLIVLFLVFFVMTFIVPVPEVCNLIYAFVIYIFVGYFRRFNQDFCDNKKKNLILFFVGFGLFLVLAIAKYLLATKISFFQTYPILMYTVSPFIAISMFGLMNVFRKCNIHSKTINYLSSCSLFVYCFHENYLLRTYIRPQAYEWCIQQFGTSWAIGWIMISALIMFVGGFILSIIYKETFHRLTAWLSKLFNKWLDMFTGWLEKKIYQ